MLYTLYTVSKIKESETSFNEAPFDSIKSFTKIKLYKNTWNVLYFCLIYYIADQSNSQSPIHLPFRRPVWSWLIKRSKTFSNLVAMTFDAILWSTFSNVIGRQFACFRRFESSFGRTDITPLCCKTDISPFTYASLKQFT